MKKAFTFVIIICSTIMLASETNLSVCKFPDGKKAMLALTFDDLLEEQCKYAPSILEKYGFKATFFMIPAQVGNTRKRKQAALEDILLLIKAGHEIGNHALNHNGTIRADLEKGDFESVNHAVVGGQDAIQEMTGIRPLSFCYPYNRRSEETDKWILQTHWVLTTKNRKFPRTPDKLKSHLEKMIEKGVFGDTMIHGIIEGYDHYNSVEEFEEWIAVIKKFENDIAIGTMLETGCYEKRVSGTKLSIMSDTSEKTVYLLELAPEYLRYEGELSLMLRNTEEQTVYLNGSKTPVSLVKKETGGIFKAKTGDIITVLKR